MFYHVKRFVREMRNPLSQWRRGYVSGIADLLFLIGIGFLIFFLVSCGKSPSSNDASIDAGSIDAQTDARRCACGCHDTPCCNFTGEIGYCVEPSGCDLETGVCR